MSGVLIPTFSEAGWLEQRRKGVSASEIAVVMGLSPYSSPFALYHRKLGHIDEQPESDAMAVGRALENYVADVFAKKFPQFVMRGSGRELWRSSERDWQLATPDRTLYESPELIPHDGMIAVLECKLDNGDGFGDEGSDEIPVHYRCQVLWQMDTLSVSTGYLACLNWRTRRVQTYELTLDDKAQADLKLMRAEASLFMQRLQHGPAPEPDWRPATASALRQLHPSLEDRSVYVTSRMATHYRSANDRYDKAKRRRDELVNQLRAQMGSARFAVDPAGETIARRDVYPVREHVRKASLTDRLVQVKPKPTKDAAQ